MDGDGPGMQERQCRAQDLLPDPPPLCIVSSKHLVDDDAWSHGFMEHPREADLMRSRGGMQCLDPREREQNEPNGQIHSFSA